MNGLIMIWESRLMDKRPCKWMNELSQTIITIWIFLTVFTKGYNVPKVKILQERRESGSRSNLLILKITFNLWDEEIST